MKRCEVLSYFTLKKFNELRDIVRANENNNTKDGELFVGDTFTCDEKMADYLTGNNDSEIIVVKIVEEVEGNSSDKDTQNEVVEETPEVDGESTETEDSKENIVEKGNEENMPKEEVSDADIVATEESKDKNKKSSKK